MNPYKQLSNNRTIALMAIFALFISLIVWQGNTPVSNAQSTGAFGSAIIELIPTGSSITGQTTINGVLSQTGSGPFYIEGVVVQNRTVSNCAVSGTDLRFNFGGTRVGIWRMWGFRTEGAGLNAATPPTNSLTGGRVAVVNMSIDLESFNGTIQLQGTLGRVFGAIESAGPAIPGNPTDILAITGGTGTFRSASGDATITPLVDSTRAICPTGTTAVGGFQVALKESPRLPRFGNIIP